MWERTELKARARDAFRANRMTCILAGFLLSMTAGSGGGSFTISEDAKEAFNISPEMMRKIVVALGVISIVSFIITVFILNPLKVGLRKFFAENASDHTTGLNKHNVGVSFSDGNYTNVVAAMFTTGFFIGLWAMLFFIPGVIKSYSWRMVPYIMAEDPQITGTEARLRSARMMEGSRWKAFVLDLSFIGWIFVGILTLGIGMIVWTSPYIAATDAELYHALRISQGQIKTKTVTVSDDDDRDTVTFD